MSQLAASNAFAYVAVRPTGGKKFGVRSARNVGALAESLRTENQLLLSYWKLPGWAAKESQLGIKDHVAINEQLANLLSRGVPLVEALDVIAQTVRPATRPRMLRIREMVAGGTAFSDACRAVGGFDVVTVAVYKAAERSGDLAGAGRQLADTARRTAKIQGKAGTLMIYPVIVLSISLLVAVLMITFIVPMIGEGLANADIKLPGYTMAMVATGNWIQDHSTMVMLGIAVAVAGLLVVKNAILAGFQQLMRRAPLISQVVLAQEAARFFSVMAAMTRTGVPFADALGVANQAVTHPVLRRQLERLRSRLIEGGLLRSLIDEVSELPISTRRLLIAAERGGDMESAFTTLAGDMTDEVERRSERLISFMQPGVVIVMFLVIGSLLVSILMPLLTLTNNMGR
jgi:type II secretory pathway component PulF